MEIIQDIKEIKTGSILLVSADTVLATLIRDFQQLEDEEAGLFNHSGVFAWIYEELFVFEAVASGIRLNPFRKSYLEDDHYKILLQLKPKFDVDGSEYGRFMLPYTAAGRTHYDFWSLLVAHMVRILTRDRVWLGEKVQDDHKFVCHEFSHFVHKHFRPDLFPEESQKVSGVQLYRNENFEHNIIRKLCSGNCKR